MTDLKTQPLIAEHIDYTTIARLLTDLGVPIDRGRYLIEILATPDHRLRQSVRVWAMDAAIKSARLSAEQLTILQSALSGNPSKCHTMHQNAAENSPP